MRKFHLFCWRGDQILNPEMDSFSHSYSEMYAYTEVQRWDFQSISKVDVELIP